MLYFEYCVTNSPSQLIVIDIAPFQAGMTTEDIDVLVHRKITESGAYPSPLNYLGFPKSVCTSVNNVACHGIPDDRQLVEGDIVSVDVTVSVFVWLFCLHFEGESF